MKKHLKKFKHLLKRKRHHVGYTTSAILFLGLGALLAQNDAIPILEPPPDESQKFEEQVFPEDIVDPREVENAFREIGRLKIEARGLSKRVARLKNREEVKHKLNEIIKELDTFAANIKNPPSDYTEREVLMEFYEARMWEEVGAVRAQIELPQILKDIPLAIRRIEKLLKLKAYQTLGIDMQGVTNYLSELKTAHAEADRLYKAGDTQSAMEEIQFIQESGHPGELEGAIRRLKEINDLIKRVRDKQIQKELSEMLFPITEAINEGDFRVANEILNEVHPLVTDVSRKSYKASAKTRTDILKRLSDFEGKMNSKMEEREEMERIGEEKMMEELKAKEPAQIQPIPIESSITPTIEQTTAVQTPS
ncbi:MAG: hypothetical protein UW40_C0016G0003 [Parcubacteria group bacterium GW2011_GWF2_44_17]|nr:MAG: hypothetical protein UW40_C0016G0003 [Parcubacteria group bacterium GW2011_GWF2_44_17]